MVRRNFVSRRQFLEASGASVASAWIASTVVSGAAIASGSKHVIAGAIRWDAWYQRSGASLFAQNTLSSSKYSGRAPFFCTVGADSAVKCIGSPSEMSAEIRAASLGGLKYWAFDWYAPDSSLMAAWNLYQGSEHRHEINWCAIVGLANLGSLPFSNGRWQATIAELAQHMRQSHYQKVAVAGQQRPLLYILWDSSQLKDYFDGQPTNVKVCINHLTSLLTEAGIAAPYVVILDALHGSSIAESVSADAISSYISSFQAGDASPYRELDRQTQEFWSSMTATGSAIVPIAMIGWDTRARQERPVPWETGGATVVPGINSNQYYSIATPAEFAAHLLSAVQFIGAHPRECAARTLLIYSWDECDEGGGLIPTLGDPKGGYLHALSAVLR